MISSGNANNRFVSQPTFHQSFDFVSFEFLWFNFVLDPKWISLKVVRFFHNWCHPWFLIGLIHLGIWSYCQKLVSTKGHIMPKNRFQSQIRNLKTRKMHPWISFLLETNVQGKKILLKQPLHMYERLTGKQESCVKVANMMMKGSCIASCLLSIIQEISISPKEG